MKHLSESNRPAGRRAARFARARYLGFTAVGLALAMTAPVHAYAEAAAPSKDSTEVSEVVVNGIPYKETVLPTRLQSSSAYGLNLNVMDTPRNTTLLSKTQLDTLNVTDPRAFSYLTSSSYTDAAFGTPNIPRIRTQYADLFYNGMRDSLTQNGYGVPVNFDAIDNISITKGPASVIDGPGPGVGGEVDFLTKRPNMNRYTGKVEATFDSVGNRRWVADVSVPLIPGDLGVLLSYSGEFSDSYFTNHFFHKNAVYGALRWQPTDKYKLDFNTEVNVEQYTENVGINRANQALIDNGTYLTGQAAPGDIFGYGTLFDLTGTTKLSPKVTIDETPGTVSRGWLYNAQLIQSYRINDNLTLENNTLFMFQNSDNQEAYYYADQSHGSYTIESRTTLTGDYTFHLGGATVANQVVVGGTYRFAHINYISNFNNEAVSVWDLSGNPNSWRLDPSEQQYGNAVPFRSVFGATLYGVAGRDTVGAGNTGVSDLSDGGIFFQDRMEFSPQFSVLFGGRIDVIQDHTHDPLDCNPNGFTCMSPDPVTGLSTVPADYTTGSYGLGNANFSAVYKFTPQVSAYLTVDWAQGPPNPNGGEGGINVYDKAMEHAQMRNSSYLYEAGVKLNLLNNKLFMSGAVFDQKHSIPTGAGATSSQAADTYGIELEGNYQPTRNLFATASYSYIRTKLNTAPAFYDFPAQLGGNIDGGGNAAVFRPGQTFDDPDQPQHVFNFLANYKFPNGIGLRTALQVTGPISLTASGYLDIPATTANLQNDFFISDADIAHYLPSKSVNLATGYYKSPTIPWQYTWNLATFYEFQNYRITFSVYNVTDQKNWQPSPGYYGNDFLVRSDPRTYEVRLEAKF